MCYYCWLIVSVASITSYGWLSAIMGDGHRERGEDRQRGRDEVRHRTSTDTETELENKTELQTEPNDASNRSLAVHVDTHRIVDRRKPVALEQLDQSTVDLSSRRRSLVDESGVQLDE